MVLEGFLEGQFGPQGFSTSCGAHGSSHFREDFFKVFPITVSHFSYAPLFQSPHFLTKMLESNILYDYLLFDIYLFDNIEKNIRITHANHSATSKAILRK